MQNIMPNEDTKFSTFVIESNERKIKRFEAGFVDSDERHLINVVDNIAMHAVENRFIFTNEQRQKLDNIINRLYEKY